MYIHVIFVLFDAFCSHSELGPPRWLIIMNTHVGIHFWVVHITRICEHHTRLHYTFSKGSLRSSAILRCRLAFDGKSVCGRVCTAHARTILTSVRSRPSVSFVCVFPCIFRATHSSDETPIYVVPRHRLRELHMTRRVYALHNTHTQV